RGPRRFGALVVSAALGVLCLFPQQAAAWPDQTESAVTLARIVVVDDKTLIVRTRPADLSITHNSVIKFVAEVDVSEAGEATPEDHVSGRRIFRSRQVTSQLRDRHEVLGQRLLRC